MRILLHNGWLAMTVLALVTGAAGIARAALEDAWVYDPTSFALVPVDPRTGSSTGLLSPLPMIAGDPVQLAGELGTGRVYALVQRVGGYELYTVDTVENSISGPLTVGPHPIVVGIAVSPATGEIFVVFQRGAGPVFELGTLSARTGLIQSFGQITFLGGAGAIDAIVFTPRNRLQAIERTLADQVRVWEIDPYELQATTLVTTVSLPLPPAPAPIDADVLYGDLFVVAQGTPSVCYEINRSTGAVTPGFTVSGVQTGIARIDCAADASPILRVTDVEDDDGGEILLDWSGYVVPAGFDHYEIRSRSDPCALVQGAPGFGVVTTLGDPGVQTYVHATPADFRPYWYEVRVLDGGGTILDSFAGGFAVSRPNFVINEFNVHPDTTSVGLPFGQRVEIRNPGPPSSLVGYRLSATPAMNVATETLASAIGAGERRVFLLGILQLNAEGGRLALLPPSDPWPLDVVDYGDNGGAPITPPGTSTSAIERHGPEIADRIRFSFGQPTYGPPGPIAIRDLERTSAGVASTPGEPSSPNDVREQRFEEYAVINEVLYDEGDPEFSPYVELYNPHGTRVGVPQYVLYLGGESFVPMPPDEGLEPGEVVVFEPGSIGASFEASAVYLLYCESGDCSSNDRYWLDTMIWYDGPGIAGNANAVTRIPDGEVRVDDAARSWSASGGDVALFYAEPTFGLSNGDPRSSEVLVDPDGEVDGVNVFATIQDAVDNAPLGASILVDAGTYLESVLVDRSVRIVGRAGSSSDVIVVAPEGQSAFRFMDPGTGVELDARVGRMTIQGTEATEGGAALVEAGRVRFENVVFTRSSATQSGGAVHMTGRELEITACLFYLNSSDGDGGAISVNAQGLTGEDFVEVLVTDTVFVANQARRTGGVLVQRGDRARLKIENCVFDRNGSYGDTGLAAMFRFEANGTLAATDPLLPPVQLGANLTRSIFGTPVQGRFYSLGSQAWVQVDCTGYPADAQSPLAPGTTPASATVTVGSEFFGDPDYCQPLAFNYALGATSDFLTASVFESCPERLGVLREPCADASTDADRPAGPTRLLGAAPNPFNPRTQIEYFLPARARVELDVFDARGRRVGGTSQPLAADGGTHKWTWAGVDPNGRALASGVYFVSLRTNGVRRGEPLRVVLIR